MLIVKDDEIYRVESVWTVALKFGIKSNPKRELRRLGYNIYENENEILTIKGYNTRFYFNTTVGEFFEKRISKKPILMILVTGDKMFKTLDIERKIPDYNYINYKVNKEVFFPNKRYDQLFIERN